VELQGRAKELQAQGLGLATISYDSREVIGAFAKQHGITFPMLSDPGSETIKRYGILNTVVAEAFGPNRDDPAVREAVRQYISEVNPSPNMAGIAFPGTFVLDPQGRVTSRFFEDYYWERTTTANILMRAGIGAAPVQATQASTQHLDFSAYPSDAAVSLGTRFSLAVEVTPKNGMHVYAPGASNYRVISLNISSQPHVRTTPVRYPASEIYHFVPLNERVPTYQKPFLLALDVVAEATPEGRKAFAGKTELVVNGTLEYQACDDKICYNPVSLPVSWKVALKPNVAGAPQPATR
jgi:peroxiredoxin